MPSYRKTEARDWAWQHLKGCANVIIPSYTADLKGLNERGIRHDARKSLEHGFAGTLLVSETALSLAEYGQFFEWSNDESKGRLKLVLHASFNTLEENIEAAKIAEANGGELVLLSYPANFYPESLEEVYAYTKAFCDATNLAILLFPVPLWGFSRLHASVIRKLLDHCPNIVAIKAEGGMPSIMGFVECHRLFGKEVIVETPLFGDLVPLAQLVPIQFTGTSNTHFFGNTVPHVMELLQQKKFDEATEIYWRTAPADDEDPRSADDDAAHRLDALGPQADGLARQGILHRAQSGRGGDVAQSCRSRIASGHGVGGEDRGGAWRFSAG